MAKYGDKIDLRRNLHTMTGTVSISFFYRTARGGGEGLALSWCAC